MSTKSDINRYSTMSLVAAEKDIIGLANTNSVASVHFELAKRVFGQGVRAHKAGESLKIDRLWNAFAKTFYDPAKGGERKKTPGTLDNYKNSQDAFLQAGLSGIDGIEGAVVRVFDAPKIGQVADRARIIRGIVKKQKLPTETEWKELLRAKKKAPPGGGTTIKGATSALHRSVINFSKNWIETGVMTPEMVVLFARIQADVAQLAKHGAGIAAEEASTSTKKKKKTFADTLKEQEAKIAAAQAAAAKALAKSAGTKTLN